MTPHWRIRQAARLLKAGGVVAYPTESVFGLGCDPWNPHAVLRLLLLKRRAATKGLILIAADDRQLGSLGISEPTRRRTLARPGARPVTWLVDAPRAPRWIRGAHTKTAVRIVNHPVAEALCRAFSGPIVSTSANISGGAPPARTALKVRLMFGGQLDYVLGGDSGPFVRPSEIRDAETGKVLRR